MQRGCLRGSVGFLPLAIALSCSGSSVPSPFVDVDSGSGPQSDAGADGAGGGAPFDAGPDADPTLGGPCVDDAQCDDGLECTFDSCDSSLDRCRNVPDDSQCQNDVFCDGVEVCSPLLGCRPGEPVACSDEDTCTIDSCVEADQTCRHEARDADGDGDPDGNCPGGGDCNESDPDVSSLAAEVCANAKDDDCDGEADETDCLAPEFDTCLDPLEISGDGTFRLNTLPAKQDVTAVCAGSGPGWRDLVAALVLEGGPPAVDVDLVATAPGGNIALASATLCGDASTETACAEGFAAPTGGRISRLRLRSLPPDNLPVYVFSDLGTQLDLTARFLPPTERPDNETCGTAAALTPGVSERVDIVDAFDNVPSDCSALVGDLVYSIEVTEPQDLEVFATSVDGLGLPSVSLRGPGCTELTDELTCQTGPNVALFARALPAGTYFVSVDATAPTTVDLVAELSPPSTPPPDESCVGAPPIAPNQDLVVVLANHADDANVGCALGYRDAAYALELSAPTDVLLVERLSDGDSGAISLASEPCTSPSDAIACGTASRSPNRAAAHSVAPGSHRVVIESRNASPVVVTALTRDAVPPSFVAFADTCAQAVEIPSSGGFFQGNTANVEADYDTSCDLGGQPPGGSPEQMLRLVLSERKRVVLDMKGSVMQTVLTVRAGPDCPGEQVPQACAAGFVPDRSFLDLVLDAGEYFVQVDGYSGDSGPWQLEVFIVDAAPVL